jgi:hypothetical protein
MDDSATLITPFGSHNWAQTILFLLLQEKT